MEENLGLRRSSRNAKSAFRRQEQEPVPTEVPIIASRGRGKARGRGRGRGGGKVARAALAEPQSDSRSTSSTSTDDESVTDQENVLDCDNSNCEESVRSDSLKPIESISRIADLSEEDNMAKNDTGFKSETVLDNGLAHDHDAEMTDSKQGLDVGSDSVLVEKNVLLEADNKHLTEPGCDTEDVVAKKPHLEADIRSRLPQLETLWKTVEIDRNDFSAWTFLLQYVDQERDVECAREAYNEFLKMYPLCYGYWKKYADYEKRNGNQTVCEQVFRNGLNAIALSVDLWVHYLLFIRASHATSPDFIRSQFEDAVNTCGLDYRSDKMWDQYISWEKEVGSKVNVLRIYDRLLQVPTHSNANNFESMKSFILDNPTEEILTEEERDGLKERLSVSPDDLEKPDDERLKKLMIAEREKILEITAKEAALRSPFEESIKRPYFHVKPLEKGQLKNWHAYLDFEISKSVDTKRVIVLFERCLIACSLYEDFWIKYAMYLQALPTKDVNKIRDVFVRACTIYHQSKPSINLLWCFFEESIGNFPKVLELLEAVEKRVPDSVLVQYRRIQFERRRGHLEECQKLFEKYIDSAKDKSIAVDLTIKYAQFLVNDMNGYPKALENLKNAISSTDNYALQTKLIMTVVDLAIRYRDIDSANKCFEAILQNNEVPNDLKLAFAKRNTEFQEDYGSVESTDAAQRQFQSIVNSLQSKTSEVNNSEKNQTGTSHIAYNNQYAGWDSSNYSGTTASYNQQDWNSYSTYYNES